MNKFKGLVICLICLNQSVLESKLLENLSLNKSSYQSGDWHHNGKFLAANLANDGNSDDNVENFHCSCTLRSNPSWWMVDLHGLFVVKQIVFSNSNSNDGDLYSFSIEVFKTDPRLKATFPNEPGELCYKTEATLGPTTYPWNCTPSAIGRFVRVVRYFTCTILICEIIIMGYLFDPNDGRFVTNKNSLLQLPPILNTTKRSSLECAFECLKPRQDQICMGFNWISSTKQCQLMDFSTRNTSLSSLLVYNTNATFSAMGQIWIF